MIYNREMNNKFNHIHKTVVSTVYRYIALSLEEFLLRGKPLKIHVRNFWISITEMFAVDKINGFQNKERYFSVF